MTQKERKILIRSELIFPARRLPVKSSMLMFFIIALVLVSWPGIAANPTAAYLKELQQGGRFTRDAEGVITDNKTGMRWFPLYGGWEKNWEDTYTWAHSLKIKGGGWKIPSVRQLQTLPSGAPKMWQFPASCWGEAYGGGQAWEFIFGSNHLVYQDKKSCISGVLAVQAKGIKNLLKYGITE